jgi:hypothetical protein
MMEEKPQTAEEIRLIPWWAYALAAVGFVAVQALMHFVGFRREPHPPPFVLQIFFGLLAGTILAFFVLLVGYVNRDAKRRAMNVPLWTVLVIFIPNGIGFIIYFLLRLPLLVACPQCGTAANPSFNYCPNCKFNLHPACPECHRPVRVADTYCPYCAHEFKQAL